MAVCQNPVGAKHDLIDGGRLLSVQFQINWGDQDIRDRWEGGYEFCSFACMAAWATQRAADHDQHVLAEGA